MPACLSASALELHGAWVKIGLCMPFPEHRFEATQRLAADSTHLKMHMEIVNKSVTPHTKQE